MPVVRRPGSNRLRSMRARAEAIGAALTIAPGSGGRGTRTQLSVPTGPQQGSSDVVIRILIVDRHPAMRTA
jgi:hypothetical protein